MTASPKSITLLTALALTTGCQSGPADHPKPVDNPQGQETAARAMPEGFHGVFASQIEGAHGIDAWRAHEVIVADVRLTRGEQTRMEATLTFETTGGKVRLDPKGGGSVLFDGNTAWVSPEDLKMDKPRFHVLTWPYFIAAPFKLADPGTTLVNYQERPLLGTPYPTGKLTFGTNVGDTPDDWYVAYQEPESQRLKALAYIVTYGKDAAQAEAAPHAMVYDGFETVDGVTLSTQWAIYDWSLETGPYGEPLTEGTLSNIRFGSASPDMFEVPAGAKEVGMP